MRGSSGSPSPARTEAASPQDGERRGEGPKINKTGAQQQTIRRRKHYYGLESWILDLRSLETETRF